MHSLDCGGCNVLEVSSARGIPRQHRLDQFFSPDGTRIGTALANGTVRVSDLLLPSAGPRPKWFPGVLRYMAQMRLNPDGELETLKTADWFALREKLRGVLRASANADTPYLRTLRPYVHE